MLPVYIYHVSSMWLISLGSSTARYGDWGISCRVGIEKVCSPNMASEWTVLMTCDKTLVCLLFY